MGILVFWIIMAAVVAIIANSKGLSAGAWFFYGLLIWPIALVHVLVSKPDAKIAEQRSVADGEMRKCPKCAELVRREAVMCRFCGSELPKLT